MSHFGRSGPPDIADTYSLLVLNIAFRTTADDLFPLFDKYGKVVDVFIPRDRRTGRVVAGREIKVQFAKYGPNAERIQKGRIIDKVPRSRYRSRSRSPRRRYRDDYRERDSRQRSHSRSPDRYERDRYRDRDDHCQSRSPSAGPDYSRGRRRDRYSNEHKSRSRSVDSASPYQRRSPYRSRSLSKSPRKDRSPDRHNRDRQSPARSASTQGQDADSQSPSP